jgi:site-specific recombinase XerD
MFFRYLIATEKRIDPNSKEFSEIDIRGITVADLEKVTTETIYRFLFYVDQQRGNGTAAKMRKLSALRSFFKYLYAKKHLISHDPTADIDGPKKRSTLPKFLNLEESRRLLAAVENDLESKSRVRDYAIITLFLNCGMRVSELVGINLTDIDPELTSLRVTGKGAKQRMIYLNDACRVALRAYMHERLEEDPRKKNTDALFLSSRVQRISVKTVQWMVYRYLNAAGLSNRGLSVHKLRHTAATLMYQTGKVDIRVLKDILGHEQLNTTQIYTHVSDEGMKQAMESNPLSDVKHDKD